jgi:hypothetical protein
MSALQAKEGNNAKEKFGWFILKNIMYHAS